MHDPVLAGATLATVLLGLWMMRPGTTSPATWFFFSWGLTTLAIAIIPLHDSHPVLSRTYLVYGSVAPALILGGTLVLMERRPPEWLLPSVFAYGLLRTLLSMADQTTVANLMGLPTVCITGYTGVIAIRHQPRPGNHRAFRLLAPALIAMSALGVASILSTILSGRAPTPMLLAWLVAGPVLLAIQLYAVAEHNANVLRRARDVLEEMVAERTTALAQANASLQHEIEERQQALRALAESEKRYRAISELSSDFSFSIRVDPDLGIRREWVTEAFERITGYPAETLDGARWAALLHGDGREASEADHELARGQADNTVSRYRIVRPDGEPRWIDVKLRTETDAETGVSRVLGAARDVTEAHLSEEARLELERQIEAAQRVESLGMLTGGIAHDFNNLLAVILGNTRLVQEELPDDAPAAAKLVRVRSAAEHAARLTEQMLTYSGKAIVSLAPIELSGLVHDLSDLLRDSLGRDCVLRVQLDGDLVIEGDVSRLSQVILNLVTNAHEALPDGRGLVTIRAGRGFFDAGDLARASGAVQAEAGEYAFVEVSDDGVGMDADVRRRIFEPFFTTKFSGRGLGLASVLGIIRAHGGLVTLESEIGRGTRVRVLLPPSRRRPEIAIAPEPIEAAPERILVVDDDEAVLELAGEFLRRAGYACQRATGGREAIDYFATHAKEIDVVVLDLTMPGLDGREVFEELRRIRPDVPVVLATGYSREALEESFPDEQLVSFLRKPYEPEQLLEAIRAASHGAGA